MPPQSRAVSLVGIGARVDGAGEAQVGELVEGLVAEERLADDVGAVVGRRLRIDQRRGLEEAALREVLCVCGGSDDEQKQEFHCSRRSAWTVKSSSFSGMLYSSFSMRSTVRLLRRRSVISWVRARPDALNVLNVLLVQGGAPADP